MSTFKALLRSKTDKNLFIAAVAYTELENQEGIKFSCEDHKDRPGWFVATLTASTPEADRTLRGILYMENAFTPLRDEIIEVTATI